MPRLGETICSTRGSGGQRSTDTFVTRGFVLGIGSRSVPLVNGLMGLWISAHKQPSPLPAGATARFRARVGMYWVLEL